MTANLLAFSVLAIFIVLPLLCGLVSWEAGRFEHRWHRRSMEAREQAMRVREDKVKARELELGRRAHDLHTMLNMRKWSIENDTTVLQVMDWEEMPA